MQHELDLFVFRGPDAGSLVFAVVVAAIGARSGLPGRTQCDVCIHAGRKSWTVRALRPRQVHTVLERHGRRLFADEVLGRRTDAGTRYDDIVLECLPDFACAGESLVVWAEVHGNDGSRFRVGNPFVAEILARDPVLCNTYHAASLVEDRALFTDVFASTAAASGHIANPDAHAQRLPALLLPDVIEYRLDLPVGFNLASRNGRHPIDDTAWQAYSSH